MITPHDFLTVAKDLAARASEAEWRTVISRAYYAAFHTTRNLLKDLGFVAPYAWNVHNYLSARLSNSGDAQVQKAGADLSSLQRDRNRADYDFHRTLSREPHAW